MRKTASWKKILPAKAKIKNKRKLFNFIDFLLSKSGLINIDYADVQTVFHKAKYISYGYGLAWAKQKRGKGIRAGSMALSRLGLDKKFKSVIFNVTGGNELSLHEINDAANQIYSAFSKRAHVIFGATIDKKYRGKIRVDVVGTFY